MNSSLRVVMVGGWGKVIGKFAGHSFLECQQLFAAKDIKRDGRKLALLNLAT